MKELDVVELIAAYKQLEAGQRGTVVHVFDEEQVLVEFAAAGDTSTERLSVDQIRVAAPHQPTLPEPQYDIHQAAVFLGVGTNWVQKLAKEESIGVVERKAYRFTAGEIDQLQQVIAQRRQAKRDRAAQLNKS